MARIRPPPATKSFTAIAQFSHTLDKNTATQLFKLLNKYWPGSKLEKKTWLEAAAKGIAEENEKDVKPEDTKKPPFLK